MLGGLHAYRMVWSFREIKTCVNYIDSHFIFPYDSCSKPATITSDPEDAGTETGEYIRRKAPIFFYG